MEKKRDMSHHVGAQHSTQCIIVSHPLPERGGSVGSVVPPLTLTVSKKRLLPCTKIHRLGYRVSLLFLPRNMRGNAVGVTVPNKLRVPRCFHVPPL